MKFIQYIKDSFEELNNHMTWSSSKEAQKTTVTVAVFTIGALDAPLPDTDEIYKDVLEETA